MCNSLKIFNKTKDEKLVIKSVSLWYLRDWGEGKSFFRNERKEDIFFDTLFIVGYII